MAWTPSQQARRRQTMRRAFEALKEQYDGLHYITWADSEQATGDLMIALDGDRPAASVVQDVVSDLGEYAPKSYWLQVRFKFPPGDVDFDPDTPLRRFGDSLGTATNPVQVRHSEVISRLGQSIMRAWWKQHRVQPVAVVIRIGQAASGKKGALRWSRGQRVR